MDLTIERITLDSWQEYKAIRLRALKEEPNAFSSTYERESAWTNDEWQKRAQEPESVILLAKIQRKTVGLIGIYWKGNQKERGEIWATFVDRDYRRRGVGRLLMQAIEEEARKNGTKIVTLGVIKGRNAALTLYKSLGYKETKEKNNQEKSNGIHFDSYYYEKTL